MRSNLETYTTPTSSSGVAAASPVCSTSSSVTAASPACGKPTIDHDEVKRRLAAFTRNYLQDLDDGAADANRVLAAVERTTPFGPKEKRTELVSLVVMRDACRSPVSRSSVWIA